MKFVFTTAACAAACLAFPAFSSGIPIEAGGSPIVSGYNSSPTVADWNGDGLSDLLIACLEDIGDEKLGTIRFYSNSGTAGSPEFTEFSMLMADGDTLFTQGHC